jgi:hypothetical protein
LLHKVNKKVLQGTKSFFILGVDTGEEEIVAFAMLTQSMEEALTVVAATEVHSGGELGDCIDHGRGEREGDRGGGSRPKGWLKALRHIAMGFVVIGPTLRCLAIAYAIELSGHRVRGAIDRAVDTIHDRLVDAMIAT